MAGGIHFLKKIKGSGEKGTGMREHLQGRIGGSLWEGEV